MNNYFNVGDTVYHQMFGKGQVVSIDCGSYPLIVEFQTDGTKTFTLDGIYKQGQPVSLSQKPIPEIVNVPKVQFTKGDVVLVSDNNKDWVVRFFVGKARGENYPFVATSYESLEGDTCYKYCKKLPVQPIASASF